MSEFQNGGGDLAATNKIAALLELAFKLASAEDEYNADTPGAPVDRVTMSLATPLVASFTAVLPIRDTKDTTAISVAPRNYLSEFGEFDPGTAGDITSTHLPGAFFEAAQVVHTAEKLIRANVVTNAPNTVTIATDLEARTATIVCNLPVGYELAPEGILMKAFDFLPA